MIAPSTLTRAAPVAASCLLHAGLVAAMLALGPAWPARPPIAIVEADLVPAEAPAPPPPLEPERPKPEKKVARVEPPKPVVLPRPIDPPRREVVADPPSEPAPPPVPAPVPRVESAAPPAPAPSESSPSADAQARRRSEPTGPAVDAGPGPAIARATVPGPPAPASTPSAPTATARVVPDGPPSQLARPRGGYQVKPSYPASARRLGIEGTTLLRVFVAPDGQVTDIQVDESAGHPDLDRAAADAVRRWRFEPGRRGAEPVGMWVRLPVQFVLK